ncbi:trypsin-like peptidase domain-containing protein [Bradyrhizobium sp. CCGB12]|uniref:trypsin-like serine peptidase n=1 Tax=Bradyrhizobium sp. CCGB12 TaxID=2949632 RepID=UPI0020B37EBF|nr:trypsin-like peptidase domain-containing protein [Bradyrhizobium sp. CCGB12]MCP3389193.1 trypsin-like peptidase domain-containing protein [Bradyrhizobium sp. CCGB12]
MFIKPSLIAGSERRFKQAEFSPEALNRKLGDGPIEMSVEKKRLRQRQLLAETRDVQAAEIGLERIIQGNDLDSINYLAKGTAAARPICRIQLRDLRSNLLGYGSGFLIGPGLLLTNHHVFGKPADAANSIADFNYELDISGQECVPVRFGFEPRKFFYTNDRLDFSIVAVAPTSLSGDEHLEDWGWLPLSGAPGKADPGEYLTIVQHPSGQMKQVCVRENKLLKYVGDFLWYNTDTTAGSSGSPAFNRFWQVGRAAPQRCAEERRAGPHADQGRQGVGCLDGRNLDRLDRQRRHPDQCDRRRPQDFRRLASHDQAGARRGRAADPARGRQNAAASRGGSLRGQPLGRAIRRRNLAGCPGPRAIANVQAGHSDGAARSWPRRQWRSAERRCAEWRQALDRSTGGPVAPHQCEERPANGGRAYRSKHAEIAARLQGKFPRQRQILSSLAENTCRPQIPGCDVEGKLQAVRAEIFQL